MLPAVISPEPSFAGGLGDEEIRALRLALADLAEARRLLLLSKGKQRENPCRKKVATPRRSHVPLLEFPHKAETNRARNREPAIRAVR